MASILCRCGNRLSNTSVPNDIELHIYTDSEWDKILLNDIINVWDMPRPKHEAWKCPSCERIYFFAQDGKVDKIYKLEDFPNKTQE